MFVPLIDEKPPVYKDRGLFVVLICEMNQVVSSIGGV